MNAQFWMGIALGGVVMLLLIMGIVWGGGRQNAKRAKDFNALSLEELKSRNGIGRMQVSALQVIGQTLINLQETAVGIRDALRTQNEMGTDVRDILANTQMTAHPADLPSLPTGITMKVYKDTPEHSALLEARFPANQVHSPTFKFQGHFWRYEFTSFDDQGSYDVLWRPAEGNDKPVPITAIQLNEIIEAKRSWQAETIVLQNKLRLTREDQKRLKLWADHLLDCIEAPPEPNCSCHISPPCSDCVDHGSLREAITETKAAIEAINGRAE